MKKLLTILCSLMLLTTCTDTKPISNTNHDFPNRRYSKVIAYRMDATTGSLVKNGKLSPHVDYGVLLSQKNTDQLLKLLNDPASFNDELGLRCLLPNLGIVFFTESNLPIAHLEISFECNQVQAFPGLGEQSFGLLGAQRISELKSQWFKISSK